MLSVIVIPPRGYDEPGTLAYAISSICPVSADGEHFTYVFGLEQRPQGERHVIGRPERYEFFRDSQPYSLTIEVHGGEIYSEESGWLSYKVFETMPGTKGGLWTYRRLIDAAHFGSSFPSDLSMFNWPGNDYREASIIDCPAAEMAAALQDAKRASLGFLHWVQHCRRSRQVSLYP